MKHARVSRRATAAPGRAFLLAAGVLLALWALAALHQLPLALPWLYGLVSLVTVLVYVRDKHAARHGGWRTPESSLHLLALLGGWPGALWAQQLLRHKTSKAPFRRLFVVTVLLNVAALGWLLLPPGRRWLAAVAALLP